eukprot:tig00021128_g18899.t1
MTEPTYEELGAHVRSLTDGAGGPSNCTNAILKTLWNLDLPDAMDPEAYPPRGRRLLMAIVCEALRLRDLPAEMCESNIFGIPKNGSWDGDIEGNLRPITLQEVGLKLTTGLVTKRLAEAIEKHGILKGVNYGFRKAKATDDALHLMVAILEDAKEHRKPIYLLLQDIRRAYDSVSWASMELSLRRIGAPRRTSTCTATYSNDAGRELSRATDCQTCLNSNVGSRRAASNPRSTGSSSTMPCSALNKNWTGSSRKRGRGVAYVMGVGEDDADFAPARVTGSAYADDTQWMSGSAEGIQMLADVASEFFRLHDIAVNARKTEFAYNNVSPEPEPPLLGNPASRSARS